MSLGDVGFPLFFRVVSGDFGKPWFYIRSSNTIFFADLQGEEQIEKVSMVYVITFLGGGFKHFFFFTRIPGEMIQFDLRIFFQIG